MFFKYSLTILLCCLFAVSYSLAEIPMVRTGIMYFSCGNETYAKFIVSATHNTIMVTDRVNNTETFVMCYHNDNGYPHLAVVVEENGFRTYDVDDYIKGTNAYDNLPCPKYVHQLLHGKYTCEDLQWFKYNFDK